MGWLSGTPKWYDKTSYDFRPDTELTQELEALRVKLNISHDDFGNAYMKCWWHHEAGMRMTYLTVKQMYKNSAAYKAYGEKALIAAAFVPAAQNKIGLWFKDNDEIINLSANLSSIDDAVKIMKERYYKFFSILPPEVKNVINQIEKIMEDNFRMKNR